MYMYIYIYIYIYIHIQTYKLMGVRLQAFHERSHPGRMPPCCHYLHAIP